MVYIQLCLKYPFCIFIETINAFYINLNLREKRKTPAPLTLTLLVS